MLLEEKHELRKTRVQRKPLWGLGALWVLLYWCLYLTAVSGPQTRVCMWLQSLGHGLVLAGGEWWAAVRSFVYVYSCSPSLTLPPELRLLSDQRNPMCLNHPGTIVPKRLGASQPFVVLFTQRSAGHVKQKFSISCFWGFLTHWMTLIFCFKNKGKTGWIQLALLLLLLLLIKIGLGACNKMPK